MSHNYKKDSMRQQFLILNSQSTLPNDLKELVMAKILGASVTLPNSVLVIYEQEHGNNPKYKALIEFLKK